MRFEALGKLDEAQEIYDTILQEDDTNMVYITLKFDSNKIHLINIYIFLVGIEATNCIIKGQK